MDMDIMGNVKTVCFTGHRPGKLGGYEPINPVAVWVKERLRRTIGRTVNRGVVTFISGGRSGWISGLLIL
jgi:hypothetical protein